MNNSSTCIKSSKKLKKQLIQPYPQLNYGTSFYNYYIANKRAKLSINILSLITWKNYTHRDKCRNSQSS